MIFADRDLKLQIVHSLQQRLDQHLLCHNVNARPLVEVAHVAMNLPLKRIVLMDVIIKEENKEKGLRH